MAKPIDKSKIQPPREGVTYELDEIYLSDGPPKRQQAELHLFIQRLERGHFVRRIVHTVAADTEALAVEQMKEFASRPDVTLVSTSTRKAIAKEWLDADQEQTVGG